MSDVVGANTGEFFEHLVEYQLAVCKECRYGVWPNEIEGHLQGKQHKIERQKAIAIAERVRQWPGLVRYPSELQVPDFVNQPINQLPLYTDGLSCKLEPSRCHYVCRDLRAMKEHWRKVHQWSTASKRGGSGKRKGSRIERRVQEATKAVQCQRFLAAVMDHSISRYDGRLKAGQTQRKQ